MVLLVGGDYFSWDLVFDEYDCIVSIWCVEILLVWYLVCLCYVDCVDWVNYNL